MNKMETFDYSGLVIVENLYKRQNYYDRSFSNMQYIIVPNRNIYIIIMILKNHNHFLINQKAKKEKNRKFY